MLGNLNGWHAIILLVILLMIAAAVALVVLVVVRASARSSLGSGASERLRKLVELRDQGLITETEYDAKRARLLDEL